MFLKQSNSAQKSEESSRNNEKGSSSYKILRKNLLLASSEYNLELNCIGCKIEVEETKQSSILKFSLKVRVKNLKRSPILMLRQIFLRIQDHDKISERPCLTFWNYTAVLICYETSFLMFILHDPKYRITNTNNY